ncbi:MAG: BrnT family toxin [Gemmatimonadaceae bacterium]
MTVPHFEWDPRKAAQNVRKHGVSFEEARTIFEDAEALILADPDHSAEEERFILLGLSAALRVLVVIHCERGDGAVIRIISARKADRQERAVYADRRAP